MGTSFIRDRWGENPNAIFNFGYIVLRSIVSRAIVETGLLPVLGIFHKNKYNPFCLSDDLDRLLHKFVIVPITIATKSHTSSDILSS